MYTGKDETIWIKTEIEAILKHLFDINIPVRIIIDDNYQYMLGNNKIKYFINNCPNDNSLF